MKTQLVGLGLLAVAAGVLAAPPVAYKIVSVSVTDIGTLGGDWAVAWDINNNGSIVGMSKTSLGEDHAFYYKGGAMYDISPSFARGGSEARAINQFDEVAGNYGDISYSWADHAYRWDGNAYPLNDTDPAGVAGTSRAWGISDRGRVVGQRTAAAFANTAAIVWTSDTTYVELSPAVAGATSYAKDINTGGLIVGFQASDLTPRRWRLLAGGGVSSDIAPKPLPLSMFGMGSLEGVNKNGAVTGQIACCLGTPYVRRHAWTWDGRLPTGVYIGVLWPGGFSQGEDINNNGIVAGYAQRPSPPNLYSDEWDRAILYRGDFGIYELPPLSKIYHSCRASALNDLSGNYLIQVVGVCLEVLGRYRAVRWDVKVEPVSGP